MVITVTEHIYTKDPFHAHWFGSCHCFIAQLCTEYQCIVASLDHRLIGKYYTRLFGPWANRQTLYCLDHGLIGKYYTVWIMG